MLDVHHLFLLLFRVKSTVSIYIGLKSIKETNSKFLPGKTTLNFRQNEHQLNAAEFYEIFLLAYRRSYSIISRSFFYSISVFLGWGIDRRLRVKRRTCLPFFLPSSHSSSLEVILRRVTGKRSEQRSVLLSVQKIHRIPSSDAMPDCSHALNSPGIQRQRQKDR